ncbi:DUF4138 domain-containing protein [Rapidithrix thailandica]|uniref:DUF4138 domain-containing protein n=1 Tax=Rapidithrix thailandica TaxID=413964 RepID=A0AAW9S3T7_9BACT
MKPLLYTFFLVMPLSYVQATEMDTLYVSDSATLYLVFDQPVDLVDIGLGADYHCKMEGPVVFVKAKRPLWRPSPLLVQVGNRFVMTLLVYRSHPGKFLYDYRKKPLAKPKKEKKFLPEIELKKLDAFPEMFRNKKRKKDGISMQVDKVLIGKRGIYLKLSLINTTSMDYRPDHLAFYWAQFHRRGWFKKKKSSIRQAVPIEIQSPELVPAGSSEAFYIALPVFAVGDEGHLSITLREQQGNRNLSLKLQGKRLRKALRLS